jgi:alpha-D-ribose 1-methylphosphonate 5-triphosphate synthase subunit PhnL
MRMLSCAGLSKEFLIHIHGGKRITAFRDLAFTLEPGELLGVSGPSGCGKSSLLKCIYRTYRPSAGSLPYTTAAGAVVDLAAADEHMVLALRRAEIGYVSQFLHVIPRVTALDTLANVMVARGFGREQSLARARELLERLRLPPALWELYPSTFSGGEKQRLNLIHALISRPRLLLLDEPTASLDADSARRAIELILELKAAGTAMIGVFHDRQALERLADSRLELAVAEGVPR